MWIELLCGLVLYKVLRLFFSNDDVLDIETSDFNAIFTVAARLLFCLLFILYSENYIITLIIMSLYVKLLKLGYNFQFHFQNLSCEFQFFRLEKLYGGKAYVGLRIPDADSGSRQNIDLVLVSKG